MEERTKKEEGRRKEGRGKNKKKGGCNLVETRREEEKIRNISQYSDRKRGEKKRTLNGSEE